MSVAWDAYRIWEHLQLAATCVLLEHAGMVLPLPLLASGATRIAELAGVNIVQALLGVAQVVAECAAKVKVNERAALALSRRISQFVDIVAAALDARGDATPPLEWSDSVNAFEAALLETQELMQKQAASSYLAQILHRDRDADALTAISGRVRHTFDALVVTMQMQMQSQLEALGSKYENSRALQELDKQYDVLAEEAEVQLPRLPPAPALFFGREDQTRDVVDLLLRKDPVYVAVLGGPGIGKTSLALAAVHDPAVAVRFAAKRYFVACDGAEGQSGLLGIIAGALGIAETNQKSVTRKLLETLGSGQALLVLDNFESAWEAHEHRTNAEDALAFLAGIDGLSLIVTLRGSERPRGISWTKPFLPPLTALDHHAAVQTFLSIADLSEDDPLLQRLLAHLDNNPLAIVLMANLAQFESSADLLARWDELKTGMLRRGDGQHRLNSLDASITISVASQRMRNVPEAMKLLGLLSLLPHGAEDSDMLSWASALTNPALALSTLFQTALAFRSSSGRLRVLAPIREFVLLHHLPSLDVIKPVYAHYFALAELSSRARSVSDTGSVALVAREVENIESIISHALRQDAAVDREQAIKAAARMSSFFTATGIGSPFGLMQEALAAARRLDLKNDAAELLFHWAFMAYNNGVAGDPAALYRESCALCKRTGNLDGMIKATLKLIWFIKDPLEAVLAAKEMCELAESSEGVSPRRTAWCYQRLAVAYERASDWDEAGVCQERAIAILSASGESSNRLAPYSSTKIAEYMIYRGDIASAVTLLKAAVPALEAEEYVQGVARAQRLLGEAETARGNAASAIQYLQQSVSTLGRGDFRNSQIQSLAALARAHLLAYDADAAGEAVDAAANLARDSGDAGTLERVYILCTRGEVAICQGAGGDARAALSAALHITFTDDPNQPPESMLSIRAYVFQCLGDADVLVNNIPDASAHFLLSAIAHRKINIGASVVHALGSWATTLDDDAAEAVIRALMAPLLRFQFLRDIGCMLLHCAHIALRRGNTRSAQHHAQRALERFTEPQDLRGIIRTRDFLQGALASVE